jgi:hypothetical protein
VGAAYPIAVPPDNEPPSPTRRVTPVTPISYTSRSQFEGSLFQFVEDRGAAARRMMRMSQTRWLAAAPLLAAALLLAVTADAAPTREMGNIVSTDWQKMEIDIKHPRAGTKTWKVARDCSVKFIDKKDQFPDPKLSDLRAPMYIWFFVKEGTTEIQSIEVREVGFDPSKGGPGLQQKAVITNLDANVGHVEVDMGAGPKTFKVEPKQQLNAFRRGQQVVLLIEKRSNGEEIVTKITPQR